MSNVPLLDLKRQNGPLSAGLMAAAARVLDSGQYILGREVEEFEARVAALVGTRYAVAVSSGTDAIMLALMALEIGPGDEVICPSFTFFATAGCVARVGARPVFIDSCPVCFNLDPASVQASVTRRTRAVIPVHLFGQAAAMDEVVALAKRHALAVIEDAAQALGAAYRGKPVGSIGNFGTFSFFPSKNLGGFGDSGLLTTDDAALAEKARILRVHGASPKYHHKMVGANFRMDPLQAALLAVKLPHLDAYSRGREENARHYNVRLAETEAALVDHTADCVCADMPVPGGVRRRPAYIRLPSPHQGRRHIWNQYTIRVIAGENWQGSESPRDALRRHLQLHGVASEIYYPVPLSRQECFVSAGPHQRLRNAEELSSQCLSLPVFPELTEEEKEAVVAALASFLNG
jgi:dTDP-4-amino-4,6-dideoxygalactose transaminase